MLKGVINRKGYFPWIQHRDCQCIAVCQVA